MKPTSLNLHVASIGTLRRCLPNLVRVPSARKRVREGPLPLPPPVGCLFGGEREREREELNKRTDEGEKAKVGWGKSFHHSFRGETSRGRGKGGTTCSSPFPGRRRFHPTFFPTIIYDYNLNAHVRGKGPPPSYFYCRFPHPFLPHSLGCFLSLPPPPPLHPRDKNLLVSLHFGIGGRRRVIPPGSHPRTTPTAAEKHSLCSSRARERERERDPVAPPSFN